jgi:hypothetical protein
MSESTPETTRREVLGKAIFVAPAILTLAAVPSFASTASGRGYGGHRQDDHDGPKDKGHKHHEHKNKHRDD